MLARRPPGLKADDAPTIDNECFHSIFFATPQPILGTRISCSAPRCSSNWMNC